MPADPGDELFDLPPDEFVAARDALAKRLKADGDKEASAAVKELRRPTVAAWAVNQVARSIPGRKDIAALLQVGDRLRDAHDALLEGKGDAAIREATAERRQLVAKLTKAAVGKLGAGGEAQHDAISHTFDAAVADPEAGLAVRAGRLSKELEAPSGFGGGLIFGADPAAPARATRPRREERRAARQARRSEPESVKPIAPARTSTPATIRASKPREERATPAPEGPTAADRKAAERRRKELQRNADERATEAQQAAREAAAARQEVSRLQDLLVTANAKAKAAADHAQLAQWKAATAQQALRDADSPSTSE